jgi:NADPH:quinone reductase-like Zn-dependent oxidoreductase
MLQPCQQLDSPSNEVIWVIPDGLGGLLSHAQSAWVRINEGSATSSPVVLITGALTGIGRAAAIVFAQEGARVVVSGRRERQGQELLAELQALGAEAIFVRADVRKDDDVRRIMLQQMEKPSAGYKSYLLAGLSTLR